MKKYNYITQEQLNRALAAFIKQKDAYTFDYYFSQFWVPENIASVLAPVTILSATQHAFVANVLTILNLAYDQI